MSPNQENSKSLQTAEICSHSGLCLVLIGGLALLGSMMIKLDLVHPTLEWSNNSIDHTMIFAA